MLADTMIHFFTDIQEGSTKAYGVLVLKSNTQMDIQSSG